MLTDRASGVRRSVTGGGFACAGGRSLTFGFDFALGAGFGFGLAAAGRWGATRAGSRRTTGATLDADAAGSYAGGGLAAAAGFRAGVTAAAAGACVCLVAAGAGFGGAEAFE